MESDFIAIFHLCNWVFYSVEVVLCLLWPFYFSRRIFFLVCRLLFLNLTPASPWGVHYFYFWPLVLVVWVSIEEPWDAGMDGDRAIPNWQICKRKPFPHKVARWLASLKGRETRAHLPCSIKLLLSQGDQQVTPGSSPKLVHYTLKLHRPFPPRLHSLRKLGALTLSPSSSLLVYGNHLITNLLQLDPQK